MAQYRTLRVIGERMGWAPATVLRRHKLDNFPLYLDWTKRGLIWVTSDELILKWEEGKVQMSHGARLRTPPRPRHKPTYRPYNWRLRYKNETANETSVPTRIEGESHPSLHEGPPPSPPCPCSRCSPHLHPETANLNLDPSPVINHELIPPQTEAGGVKLPETPKTPIIKQCTCGTAIDCIAHD
jgi:hypothetical protein